MAIRHLVSVARPTRLAASVRCFVARHTNQSRETLNFLANVGNQYPLIRPLMSRLERRSEQGHGMPVNYAEPFGLRQ